LTFHPEIPREGRRARPDQQDMICMLDHQTRCRDWMDDALDGRHGSSVQALPFHNRGIHPSDTVELDMGSRSCIKHSAPFHDTNGVLHGDQRRAAAIKPMMTDLQGGS
jgi:hypothetical protein